MTVIPLNCLAYPLLEALLFLLTSTNQVNLIPHFEVFFVEHGFRQANLFDDLQHSFLLEISLRVTDIAHVDK